MKLGIRLLLAPACAAVLLVAAGQGGVWLQAQANERADLARRAHQQAMRELDASEIRLRDAHTDTYRTMSIIGSMDDKATQAFVAKLQQQVAASRETVKKLAGDGTGNSELAAEAAGVAKLAETYEKQVIAALDMASVDANTGVAAMQSADSSFKSLSQALSRVAKHQEEAATAAAIAASDAAQRAQLLLAALALALGAAAVGVIWLMQRRVVSELARVSHAAGAIAEGNLTVELRSDRTDELGDLVRAVANMTRQLASALRTVQQSADSIRTASAEIASGNADLSQRTEQAAGHLQQTASSLTQLSGNVAQSAESSATASAMAGSAADVARRGGSAVGAVVGTMEDIQSSSRKIADIIGTIDGIAFQTNILALNAAVEAARAGEQGRGFAVVAGEVRLLAQRSAEAAREIKGLIGASVDKVEAGSRQVRDAGSTIDEVVDSAQKVAELIQAFTATSGEQSAGIGQVSQAVSELDRMTQQNAALVEQSAAAAASLSEQAARLADVVSGFRFSADQRSAGASAAPSARAAVSGSPAKAATARPSPRLATPAAPKAAAPQPAPAAKRATAATAEDDWATF